MHITAMICVLTLSSICFARQGGKALANCDGQLVVSMPMDSVSIEGNRLNVGFQPQSTIARMRLSNNAESSVVEIGLLVEFFNVAHARLYGIVIHEVYKGQPTAPMWMVPSYTRALDVKSHTSVPLVGMTPILTGDCPTQVEITFAYVRFASGKIEERSKPGWQTDPAVALSSDHLFFDNCHAPKIGTVNAVMTIGRDGHLSSFTTRSAKEQGKLAACLKREFALWRYVPALVNGEPRDSEIRMMLFFNAQSEFKTERSANETDLRGGFVSLTMFPSPELKNAWDYIYCCVSETRSHP